QGLCRPSRLRTGCDVAWIWRPFELYFIYRNSGNGASGQAGQTMANKPVFLDATGKRALRISLIGWGAAIVSTLLGAAFLTSLAAVPHFANVKLPGRLTPVNTQALEQKAAAPGLLRSA